MSDIDDCLKSVERLTRDREEVMRAGNDKIGEIERLRAEIERQVLHIDELRAKVDAEKSCACSYDAPGDICAAHSPSLMQARAEVERLRAEIERLKQEPELLRAQLIALTNAARNALADAYDRAKESKP